MMMPYMDGQATIRALERMNPTIRIVATSGIAGNRAVIEQTSSRVKAYIAKPYTAETLLSTIADVLKQR